MSHNAPAQPERMTQYLMENINGKLVINLRDISHTMRSLYEGRGSQKRVLMVLRKAGTITQRELTQRLDIQSGSASEVIAKLENMGLLTRSLSESDRRTADISLTEEGLRQAEAAIEQRMQRHKEMFSALTDGEKEQLLSLLSKINDDWACRYPEGRAHHGHHHGGHHHDGHHHDGHHHGGHPHDGLPDSQAYGHDQEPDRDHGCSHDCKNCAHPCGRGRNR